MTPEGTSYPGLVVSVSSDMEEWVAAEIAAFSPLAIETQDATTMTAQAKGRAMLIAGFADGAARDEALFVLSAAFPDAEWLARDITDDGWSEGWKRFFSPVSLRRLRVITPWMDRDAFDGETLVIDPGQAFGTGGHATTRLVLEFIESMADGAGMGASVLDVGTGSGVLAIACARLGATDVTGIDIDEECTRAATQNAAVNGVPGIRFDTAVAEATVGVFDLVLANIQLSVFEASGRAVADKVVSGGRLVISGILCEQKEACLALFPDFTCEVERTRDGWVGLLLRKGTP